MARRNDEQVGLAIRQHDEVGEEPEPSRRRCREGQAHEGVEGVVSSRLAPSLARSGMLGEEDGAEAGLLGRARQLAQRLAGEKLRRWWARQERQAVSDLHGASSLSSSGPMAVGDPVVGWGDS